VDREEIERPDFPIARRGYDQGAVDAHLRRVADELERLRDRHGRAAPASLAAGTSEQVKLILEAAERSAAELRDDAGRRASDHVERVEEAADGMLRRLDELQAELGALLDGLRHGGERLVDGLAGLRERVADVDAPAAAPPDPGEPPADEEDFAAVAAPQPPGEVASPPADETGARIVALNMALAGSPREETAGYLAEHFPLAHPDALLDDVYAKATSEATTSASREAGSAPREAGRPQAEAG